MESSTKRSTSNKEPDKCYLTSTPPEIRNRIYELVLQPSGGNGLFIAAPPSKALTMTCREIHAETRRMYRAAYRAFWTDTDFLIDFEIGCRLAPETFTDFVSTSTEEDIAHISSLRMGHNYYHWLRTDGIWHNDDSDESLFLIRTTDAAAMESAGIYVTFLDGVKSHSGVFLDNNRTKGDWDALLRLANKKTSKKNALTTGEVLAMMVWLNQFEMSYSSPTSDPVASISERLGRPL